MTIKTILFASAVALGLGACHHDRAVNTPANNNYGTNGDQTPAAPAPVSGSYNGSTPDQTTNPDVNGTGQTGAAGVQSNPDVNATGTGAAPEQNQNTPTPAGALNSPNPNTNPTTKSDRQKGTSNRSKNTVPSSTNGTNGNTDGDLDRNGGSGTADQPDR